jgi:hypothetical protein
VRSIAYEIGIVVEIAAAGAYFLGYGGEGC